MYKVCFNNSNKIVGFDLLDPIYYINLLNINDITKKITEYIDVQVKDSVGRKLFYQRDKISNNTIIAYVINKPNDYEYTPMVLPVPSDKIVSLVNDAKHFEIEDIVLAKKLQLLQKYNCKDCLLYELLDNTNDINFNTTMGKNIIKLESNSEAISDKLLLSNNSNISIYYESNNDIKVAISNDQKTWYDINKDEFLDYDKSELYIKVISSKETNIYCIAVIIN